MAIGPCFSRHVESALSARGLRFPARDVFKRVEFAGLGQRYLNNFSVPAILNELSWAFEETEFSELENFIEVDKGLFIDIHLNGGIEAAGRDVLAARRRAIKTAYQQLGECRMVICTLGDTECWYDVDTQLYLNTPPNELTLDRWPDRFQVRRLTLTEISSLLARLTALLKRHGHPELGILLAVAPWPETRTYSGRDVIVANGSNKALLRVAIDQVISEVSGVDYFPLYEMINLSGRDVWLDDYVHIKPSYIDRLASHLAQTYVESESDGAVEGMILRLEDGEQVPPGFVFGELESRASLMRGRPALALRYVEACIDLGKLAEARRAYEEFIGDASDAKAKWMRASLLFAEREYEAVAKLLADATDFKRRHRYWVMFTTALFETGCYQEAIAAAAAWARAVPTSSEPFRLSALYAAKSGDEHLARYNFSKARSLARRPEELNRILLETAEFFAFQGRIMQGRKIYSELRAEALPYPRIQDLRLRLNLAERRGSGVQTQQQSQDS